MSYRLGVIGGLFVIALKVIALLIAAVDALRARLWLGLCAIVAMLYLVAAAVEALPSNEPHLPPLSWLGELWWAGLVALPALSFSAMVLAWRARNELPSDEPRYGMLDRAGLAFLANGLLDTAVLVIVFVGIYLVDATRVT